MPLFTFLAAFVVAIVVIPILWLWVVHPLVLRRRDRRRSAARSRATVVELLADAKAAVRLEGWQSFGTGQSILALESSCSEQQLREALQALWRELCDDDQQKGRSGRDSNYFELYDCGVVELMEELQRRRSAAELASRQASDGE